MLFNTHHLLPLSIMRQQIAILTTAAVISSGLVGLAAAQSTNTTGPCMQTAIETRDTNLIAFFDSYHAAAKSAIQTRKEALKSAWNITENDQRKIFLKSIWKNYRTTLKSARQSFKDNRKNTWEQFKDTAKECGAKGNERSEGSSQDNSL